MLDMFGREIEKNSWLVYRLSSSPYSSNGLSLGQVMFMDKSMARCKVCSVGLSDKGEYYLRDQCYLRSSKSVMLIHEASVPLPIKNLIDEAIKNRVNLEYLKLSMRGKIDKEN